jgi:hypothetical protein
MGHADPWDPGCCSAAVLLGLALNAAIGWWWDPAAGYVLVFYAAREVREMFSVELSQTGRIEFPARSLSRSRTTGPRCVLSAGVVTTLL